MRLSRPWQDLPVMMPVRKLAERVLRRMQWIMGMIIAVVLGIVTLATTARVVLHKEEQTAQSVKDWRMHSQELCTQQCKIEKQLMT